MHHREVILMTKLHDLLKWGKSSKSVFGIIGFLLGRTVFFSAFNPFAVAFVTVFFNKREFYTIAVFTVLGLLTVAGEINVFRYIFAILMLGLFNYSCDKEAMTNTKIALLCGLSSFTGGILYTLFSNMALYYSIMSVLETVLSCVLFFIIRDNVGILNVFDSNVVQAESYSLQVSTIISDKLKKASAIFSRIARTYDTSLLVEVVDEPAAREKIIDNIKANICSSCEYKNYCWDKTGAKTYNTFYFMIDKWVNEGCVKPDAKFKQNCSRTKEVYMLSKGCIEVYRLNKLWLNKIEQSKTLVGRQLKIVSDVLSDLHSDVATGFNIDKELSNKLYKELTGLSVNSIVVCRGRCGYEISVNIPHYYNCNDCGSDIISHINEILNVKMIKDDNKCRIDNNSCVLHLVEEPELKIAPYCVGMARDGSEITGDCYTYMEIARGKYLLALADGMGSGNEAREESAASIEMYEDFMEAGFDRDVALDIINSVLLAGSERESFSTLDICTVDMYSGEAEFVKIGAVSTFILRDNRIELVKSSSLPVGILGDVDTEVVTTKLMEGDVIIMVTDGILDSTGNVVRNEKWLMRYIVKNRDKNPKALAETILKKAVENSHNSIRDDMTVLVAEIY